MIVADTMTITPQQLEILRQSPLFNGLDEAQLQQLQPSLGLRHLAQGEHLFEQGARAEAFYLLSEGQVRLYRLAPSGQEKVMEIVNPRQTFAEALMFQEMPTYPVSAQALTDSELVVINASGFVELLSGSVENCFRVMGSLSVRLRKLLGEIDALTLQNAGLRVANYLLQLLADAGGDEGTVVTLPAAKNVIASRLSIQPETLSRSLNTLSSKGIIEVEGLNVRVLNVSALRNFGS
jgi:CRP-like cAMP-binding protein